jgi:hypothetical protein
MDEKYRYRMDEKGTVEAKKFPCDVPDTDLPGWFDTPAKLVKPEPQKVEEPEKGRRGRPKKGA